MQVEHLLAEQFTKRGLDPRAAPIYPGTLVGQTLVTSGTMTNRIDRLASHGLVERLPTPGDRRGVLVRLTATGLAQVDSAMEDLLHVERDLLVDLSDAEKRALADLLRVVVAPFDA